MEITRDRAAEKAVLAGICRYGADAFFDVCDILDSSTFSNPTNQAIYASLANIMQADNNAKIDIASIYSSAEELGMGSLIEGKKNAEYIAAIADFPVEVGNVRKFAGKLRKLQITEELYYSVSKIQQKLKGVTGSESMSEIISLAEEEIINFSLQMAGNSDDPKLIGDGIMDYVKFLAENPVDQLGIPTGFPAYDKAIGGGLRPGTVNVIGARPKTGKTLLSDNIGYYIANKHCPVLNFDTEMQMNDHRHRLLAMMTDSYIYDVETGKYAQKPGTKQKIWQAAKHLEQNKVPYYHISIAGMSFEEQMAIMRRWIMRKVGLNDQGKAKDCVIIYDYLKLMNSADITDNVAEFQKLGFIMTELHNFAVKFGVPMLTFMQLNRDGINKEDSSAASGSDRIIWLCSNFTIFKHKTDDEIQQDGPENGNRKLVPVLARHGSAGGDDGNYINCHMTGEHAKIVEGKTKYELAKKKEEMVTVEDDGEDIPFK